MPAFGRGDRVHHLHRLDDQQRVARLDRVADGDERLGAGLGRQEGGADHRRLDGVDRRRPLRRAGSGCGAAQRRRRGSAAARRRGVAPSTGAASRATLILRSPSSTSISVSSLADSSSASSRTSAGVDAHRAVRSPLGSAIVISLVEFSWLARAPCAEPRRRVQCEHISARAQAVDRARRDRRDQARAAEGFAGVADWSNAPRSPGSRSPRPRRAGRPRCGCSRRH